LPDKCRARRDAGNDDKRSNDADAIVAGLAVAALGLSPRVTALDEDR
jgi:hypothetical protein